MKDSNIKILRVTGIVLGCVLATPFVLAILVNIIGFVFFRGSPECREYGYERMEYISSGVKTGAKLLRGARLEFPYSQNIFRIQADLMPSGVLLYKEDVELVDIQNFTTLLECEELKYANRIQVVRFKVKEPKIFTDKRVENPSKNEFISGGIMPWDLHQEYRPIGRGYGWKWLAKPDPQFPANKERSRKDEIDKFKIDWLKDEPLGKAEFVGLWRGGWLFRSKTPDQYVWVD